MSTTQKIVAPVVDIPAANQPPSHARPLSPFMIGPYYRPQWTSMLSIFHRITGLIMSFGAMLLTVWLASIAAGPDVYARVLPLDIVWVSWLVKVVLAGFTFAMMYHFSNGIRHLVWDTGHNLEINAAERSGKFVIVSAVVLTLAIGALTWLVPDGAPPADSTAATTSTSAASAG